MPRPFRPKERQLRDNRRLQHGTRVVKILSAIAALEKSQPEDIFYPYRPHRNHLTTRFGILFCNDKIIIPEDMRTTVIAMLHQGHPSATKMDQLAAAFWWPGIYQEIREKAENCLSWRASGKNLVTQLPSTEKNKLENLSEPNQEIQLDFPGPIKLKTRGDVYILVAVDQFSKWPTAQICKKTVHDCFKIFNEILFRQRNATEYTYRQRHLF